jgi:hypothetical protein
MSELAYNINGDPFEVPTTATAWRVRRMKKKGAPEVVYGREGIPLLLPMDAGIDELRAEVSEPGRYRLDPVSDSQRPIVDATSAYVFLQPEHEARNPEAETAPRERFDVLESMLKEVTRASTDATRANLALGQTVVERFSGMMESAAVLVRAAAGAPVPAAPLLLPGVIAPNDPGDDNGKDEDEEVPRGLDLNALVAQVVTSVVTAVCSGQMKLPGLGALLDWRRAAPPEPGPSIDATDAADAPVVHGADTTAVRAATTSSTAAPSGAAPGVADGCTAGADAGRARPRAGRPPRADAGRAERVGAGAGAAAAGCCRRQDPDGASSRAERGGGRGIVIGVPYNDHQCLGTITELVADLVHKGDDAIAQIAAEHPTTDSLVAWIRSLPQRDDLGTAGDGPKVRACAPVQRLRLPAADPNCVERAALYLGVAELIDPQPVRQLATLETPIGAHTLPFENGAPVILDPRVTRNCVECGLALLSEGPVPISPRDAVEWTAQLAEIGAGSLRNGPGQVHQAREAMMRIVEGKAPTGRDEIEHIAWLLSLSEQVARRYGPHALALVRSTAQAVAELADEAIARAKRDGSLPARNLSIEIGGRKLRPAPWASALAKIAGRVGLGFGAMAARAKLATLGVPPEMLTLVEQELRSAGIDLGMPASPPLRRPAAAISSADVAA